MHDYIVLFCNCRMQYDRDGITRSITLIMLLSVSAARFAIRFQSISFTTVENITVSSQMCYSVA